MHRYRYMTAEHVAYLLFRPSALTHVRSLLRSLSGDDFTKGRHLYRFLLPDTKRGNPRRVYTLGRLGRDYGQALGLEAPWYFNPERGSFGGYIHLHHNLALTKALISAEKWCQQQNACSLHEVRTSYELSRLKQMKEALQAIPDAWLLFEKNGKKYPILFEIDLGTENIQKYKQHVASRIDFVRSGLYERIFGVPAVVIAYVALENEKRPDILYNWTREVLDELNLAQWIAIFRFCSCASEEMYTDNVFAWLLR
jgi:hypothetical protein